VGSIDPTLKWGAKAIPWVPPPLWWLLVTGPAWGSATPPPPLNHEIMWVSVPLGIIVPLGVILKRPRHPI
jgi:hypothetical protein